MARAMYFTLEHEDLSYHTVPCTPYLGKRPAVCTSPAATVPNIDSTNLMEHNGRQPIFMMLNSSPHPSLTIQVPSVSPKTPVVKRGINNSNSRPRGKEQLVPSQSPFIRTTPVIPTVEKTTGNGNYVQALHLFSDDDSIFL